MPRVRPTEGRYAAPDAPQGAAGSVPGGAHVSHDWSLQGDPGDPGSPGQAPWNVAPAERDQRVDLPRRAGLLALAGIVGGLVLSVLAGAIGVLVAPHSNLAMLLSSEAGLWVGMLGAVCLASRRYGTGNIWRDFGVRAKLGDVGRGFVISLIGRMAGVALLIPLVSMSRRFKGVDFKPLREARHDPAFLLVVLFLVLVGAPFIEELFFRGLMQRSLVPMLGTGGAIVAQAVVFASLHMRPFYGLSNVSILLAIGTMGVVQGIVAERYRRLGPGMIAHSFFNLVATLIVIAGS